MMKGVIVATIGALLLAYEPIQAVIRWHTLPIWMYYGRMVPFFLGIAILGIFVSRSERLGWSVAIAVARIGFHDVSTRLGVFGSRSPWGLILSTSVGAQVFWLAVAAA